MPLKNGNYTTKKLQHISRIFILMFMLMTMEIFIFFLMVMVMVMVLVYMGLMKWLLMVVILQIF